MQQVLLILNMGKANAFKIFRTYSLLLILIIIEGIIFISISKDVANIYPRFNDQIQYLSEAYQGFEYFKKEGPIKGFWQTLTNPSAQGVLNDCFALIIFIIVGASREAALFVNFIFFALWQIITFSAIKQSKFSSIVAWVCIGIMLCFKGFWKIDKEGSAFDFRLDFMAANLMGIVLMAAIKSKGFISRKWSILFGALVGVTILTRFITATYFVVIYISILVVYSYNTKNKERIKNIIIATLTTIIIVTPLILVNIKNIYNYYVIGHIIGKESVLRALDIGWGEKFLLIVREAYKFQGPLFYIVILLIIIASHLINQKTSEYSENKELVTPWKDAVSNWRVLGIIFLLSPVIILTIHKQFSATVLGVLCPGTFVLITSIIAPKIENGLKELSINTRKKFVIMTGAVILLGFVSLGIKGKMQPYSKEFQNDSDKLNRLVDLIYSKVINSQIQAPKIASDQVTDFLDAQIFRVMIYERHKLWVPLIMTLPTGIFEEDRQLIINRLHESDFIFITDKMENAGIWPYDKQMRKLYPELKNYSKENLNLAESYYLFGREISFYSKY